MRTRLTNGIAVDYRGERPCDIVIENGRISADTLSAVDSTIDIAGLTLMPALVDTHCHLRDPGQTQKETIKTGLRAACAGGYSAVCAMANTVPVVDNPSAVLHNEEKAEALGLCRLIQAAAAGKGLSDEFASDYAALSRVTPIISNDGNTILSESFMEALLAASARYGFIVSTHCMPEAEIVERDLALVRRVGGRLHVGHISLEKTARLIRAAKREGLPVTCEVMPHHIFGWDNGYAVNPPMRTHEDALALSDAIRDGTVDCLATDHAPHTDADKLRGAAGISTFDHALGMFVSVFSNNGLPLSLLSRLASKNPARLLGLSCGTLEAGMNADMMVFDPDEQWIVKKSEMLSRSHNTPFEGRMLRGRVKMMIIGGRIVYDNGTFV